MTAKERIPRTNTEISAEFKKIVGILRKTKAYRDGDYEVDNSPSWLRANSTNDYIRQGSYDSPNRTYSSFEEAFDDEDSCNPAYEAWCAIGDMANLLGESVVDMYHSFDQPQKSCGFKQCAKPLYCDVSKSHSFTTESQVGNTFVTDDESKKSSNSRDDDISYAYDRNNSFISGISYTDEKSLSRNISYISSTDEMSLRSRNISGISYTNEISRSDNKFEKPFTSEIQNTKEHDKVIPVNEVVKSKKILNETNENNNQTDRPEINQILDYDHDEAKLYRAIDTKQWSIALKHLKTSSDEAGKWVHQKEYYTGKVLWLFLPIHAACFSGAPCQLITELIRAYPKGVEARAHVDKLPIHIACETEANDDVIMCLLKANPDSINAFDSNGATLMQLSRNRSPTQIVSILTGVSGNHGKKKWYNKVTSIRRRSD